jgi:tetratricopeptide (TPR) repeat protein
VVLRPLRRSHDEVEYTPVGHATGVAARLQALAPAGGVAVSEATRRLVEGFFEFESLGEMEVKGLSRPLEVYAVTGLGRLRRRLERSAERGFSPLVGRQTELSQLRRAFALACGGRGQIVGLVGEAGQGKSRLLFEFCRGLNTAGGDSGATPESGSPPTCQMHEIVVLAHDRNVSDGPLLDFLRRYFDLSAAEEDAARIAKLGEALAAEGLAREETLPYLVSYLGLAGSDDPTRYMDPAIRRQRTHQAIQQLLLLQAQRQPLVFVVEDLHWIDDGTRAFLELLASSLASAPILLVVTYRPELRHDWGGKSYYTQVRLDPLDASESATLLNALLGSDPELAGLKRTVSEKAEGNPFFIEEIVQALADRAKTAGGEASLQIPATVQGILGARIDRLSAAQKDVLQKFAVIGRRAPRPLLSALLSRPDDVVEPLLGELKAAELVYEQLEADGVHYVFKHALTHEVAYGSMLLERRTTLHGLAGSAIERLYARALDDHLDELAFHFGHSADHDRAALYLQRLGERLAARSAYGPALETLNAALDHLRRLPAGAERDQRELKILATLHVALLAVKSTAAPELEDVNRRMLDLSERVDDPHLGFTALISAWAFFCNRARLDEAGATAAHMLQVAQASEIPALRVMAELAIGCVHLFGGNLEDARRHLETATERYRPGMSRGLVVSHDIGVASLIWLASALAQSGYVDRARAATDRAVALAREVEHPFSIAFAASQRANLHLLLRDYSRVAEAAHEAKALATDAGIVSVLRQVTMWLGFANVHLVSPDAGIAEVTQVLAEYGDTGQRLGVPIVFALLAEAHMMGGRPDMAAMMLDTGAAMAEETRDSNTASLLCLVRAEVERARGNQEAALEQIERCAELTRTRGNKLFELRAAALAAEIRGDAPSRTRLAELYSWFTEGFDAPDLRRARELLQTKS